MKGIDEDNSSCYRPIRGNVNDSYGIRIAHLIVSATVSSSGRIRLPIVVHDTHR